MFWTIAEDRTLDPQYEELLKACRALGENHPRFDRRWCDQLTYNTVFVILGDIQDFGR